MPHTLTEHARTGYDGNPNRHPRPSAPWYAHELGRHFHDSGRSVPRDVRMSRGPSIRANDMRFDLKLDTTSICFTRVE